jgi:SAM-dependent methyltransferase
MTELDMDSYTRDYAAQYEPGAEDWFETVLVNARRQQVLRSLARHPHRHILEVGCGLEPFFTFSHDWTSWTVVEPSNDFVAKARDIAATHDRRVDLAIVPGYLEEVVVELRARPTPFDFIVVSSLLHEVPAPEKLLHSLGQLAEQTTVLHLNVPNVRSFHRLLALEMGLIDDLFEQSEMERKFQRTTRFDLLKLTEMCEAAGFEVLLSETYFIKPFTNAQLAAIVDHKLLPPGVLEALSRMTKYIGDLGAEMFVELRRRA